jgi:hypothetical protein
VGRTCGDVLTRHGDKKQGSKRGKGIKYQNRTNYLQLSSSFAYLFFFYLKSFLDVLPLILHFFFPISCNPPTLVSKYLSILSGANSLSLDFGSKTDVMVSR